MPKKAISVTLDAGNIVWLKGRAGASRVRSLSELLDQIVTAARAGDAGPYRSVVGTIDIDAGDPDLTKADASVRAIFDRSAKRPLLVRETPPKHRVSRRG